MRKARRIRAGAKGRTDRGRGDKCWRFRRFRRHSPHIVAEAAGPCAVTIPGAAPLPASFSSCVSLDGNGFRYDGPRTKRFGFLTLPLSMASPGASTTPSRGSGAWLTDTAASTAFVRIFSFPLTPALKWALPASVRCSRLLLRYYFFTPTIAVALIFLTGLRAARTCADRRKDARMDVSACRKSG